jgi:type VI secretion system protein ImpK
MEASAVDCVTELFAYTYHLIDVLADEQPEYETVSKTYATLIARARACGKSAGIPKKEFDDALFAVFAWVDEALLASGWQYKNEWIRHSLQKKYYNTTSAGTEFFEHLDKLTPEDRSVLEVYDYCLASGFKGCLYEPYHQEKLDSIKKITYKKLYGETEFKIPGILFPESGTIDFNQRLKRKRWKGMASSTSLWVLLPVLLFLALYYFFNDKLMHILNDTGILM